MEIIAQTLCALHCTKVHLMQKVCNCIHYSIHFSPYKDNESITAIDLNRRTSIAEQRKSRCCLTGKSNLYGMVLNSLAGAMAKKNSLVSTQPGSVLPLAESSGHLFDILFTLQGIFCYYLHKVLKRPTQAEYITLVSSGFFTSIDYLWPSVGLIKDLIRQEIRQPSCVGFEHLANPSKGLNFKIHTRRPYHG